MTDPNEQDCPVCGTPMLWKYLNTRRCPKCNPLTGHKFDGLRGLDYSDRALGIAASFKSMLLDCPEGWFTGQLSFHVNSAGAVDRIEELRITSETETKFTKTAPDGQKPVEKQ